MSSVRLPATALLLVASYAPPAWAHDSNMAGAFVEGCLFLAGIGAALGLLVSLSGSNDRMRGTRWFFATLLWFMAAGGIFLFLLMLGSSGFTTELKLLLGAGIAVVIAVAGLCVHRARAVDD